MMRHFRILLTLFALLLVGSVGVVVWKGLPLGIDFTGGASLTFRLETGSISDPTLLQLQRALEQEGFAAVEVRLHDPRRFEVLWRTTQAVAQQVPVIQSLIKRITGSAVEIERLAEIGPTLSAELRAKAVWAILLVFLIIVLYLAFAFRTVSRPVASWWYGIAAIAALIHDVAVPTALITLAAHFVGSTIDLLFVTALLAIAGYSVNDTIVVFDRLRERLASLGERAERADFVQEVDAAVRASLMRSINTSLTTLVVLVALAVWGAESTRWFALTLLVGVVAGTISSLLFAPALLIAVARWKASSVSRP